MRKWVRAALSFRYAFSNKMRIGGAAVLLCEGRVTRCRLLAQGAENELVVGQNSRLENIDLVVVGDANRIEIRRNCLVEHESAVKTGFLGE